MTGNLSTFTAYVDESGCSGNKFGDGSSQFLAMAAVIIRDDWLPEVMGVFDEARQERAVAVSFQKFSKETDKNRFVLSRLIGQRKVGTCFVAIHKPSMQGSYIRANHSNEYNYLLKMLIERVSWAVRDAKTLPNRQNGPCSIVLSEQRMYPYDAMFDYFQKLRNGAHNCRAEWGWIADTEPAVIQHNNEQPVHLADIAASAFAMAIEPKMHGMTDDRFFRNFSSTIYRKHGKTFGLKLFPDREMKDQAQGLVKLL
jgi:hypothetical protein